MCWYTTREVAACIIWWKGFFLYIKKPYNIASDVWQLTKKTLGKVYTIFEMAEKSCDVGNTANTNDYIKTDNNDSNPDGGSNIKRVSS